jgi:hypothetical protein
MQAGSHRTIDSRNALTPHPRPELRISIQTTTPVKVGARCGVCRAGRGAAERCGSLAQPLLARSHCDAEAPSASAARMSGTPTVPDLPAPQVSLRPEHFLTGRARSRSARGSRRNIDRSRARHSGRRAGLVPERRAARRGNHGRGRCGRADADTRDREPAEAAPRAGGSQQGRTVRGPALATIADLLWKLRRRHRVVARKHDEPARQVPRTRLPISSKRSPKYSGVDEDDLNAWRLLVKMATSV